MSSLTNVTPRSSAPQSSAQKTLEALYRPIADDLAAVEQILLRELRNEHAEVDELVRYVGALGGKRLRPAIMLLAAKTCGDVGQDHHVLGAVVEMIHTATLVHDDVLDSATVRRHLATVNARWGCEASVLLGDYLFSHAYYLASTLDTTYACRVIGRSTNRVCDGEIRQNIHQADLGLSEEDYLAIIDAKTAELCACSCRLGAYFAEACEEDVERLAEYGRCIGVAFQIADDVLDLVGDEDLTGKSLGTDLDKLKPTLPWIRAYGLAGESDRRVMEALACEQGAAGRADLKKMMEQYGGLSYAKGIAAQFAEQARQALSGFPDSASREALSAIAGFIVERDA